jgi:hypothetical protein
MPEKWSLYKPENGLSEGKKSDPPTLWARKVTKKHSKKRLKTCWLDL